MTSHKDTKNPVLKDEKVPEIRGLTGAELKSEAARMVAGHGAGEAAVVVPPGAQSVPVVPGFGVAPGVPVGVSSQLEHGPGVAAVTTGEAAAAAAAHAVAARTPVVTPAVKPTKS